VAVSRFQSEHYKQDPTKSPAGTPGRSQVSLEFCNAVF
jgi:hypothetical protein